MAGRKGAVTVATNMAGRGTDIMLGGNPEFLAASRDLDARAGLDPKEQLRRSTARHAGPRLSKACGRGRRSRA